MSGLTVPTRRGFVTGLAALIAAPALVRVDSLMKVKPVYVERFIQDYLIGEDALVLTMTKALVTSPIVPSLNDRRMISRLQVKAVFPAAVELMDRMKPTGNEMLSTQVYLDPKTDWHLGK